MSTQAECVKVLQTEFERLKQYLATLPADAWTKPSACALWEIRDVVAHLIGAASLYTDSITRGLRGDTSTPAGRPEPSSFQTVSPEERQQRATAGAQRTIAFRERLGNDLLEVFRTSWDQCNDLVARLGPHDWHTPCYHPRGVLPVRALVHIAVFELAIHGWDIRSSLEPSAPLSPDALAVMPDLFAECLHCFFRPHARLATPLRYRFAFTGAPSRQWDMVVDGDTTHIIPTADAIPANVTFRCDGETFALMMYGRIGLDAALGDQRIIPTGDMTTVQTFKTWFQGV